MASNPQLILKQTSDTYQAAQDVTAHFTQTYYSKLKRKPRVESGEMWAKKEGLVRWIYTKPVTKEFISTGKTAYFYEPEHAQVTQFDKFDRSPLAQAVRFVWGQGDFVATFTPSMCESDCGDVHSNEYALYLKPKEKLPSVEHVILIVHQQTHLVRMSIVFDHLGNKNAYEFKDIRFNTKISNRKFEFRIPEGVSVLRAAE